MIDIGKNVRSEMKNFVEESINIYLSKDYFTSKEIILEKDINGYNFSILRKTTNGFWYKDGQYTGIDLFIKQNDKILGQLKMLYDEQSKRFNLAHRFVDADSPIRGKELYELLERFIAGILQKFPECIGFEMYVRQKQTLKRAIEKLGFQIDYINSNNLGKIYIDNPNNNIIKVVNAYILDKNNYVENLLVDINFDENSIIINIDQTANIVLIKNL